MNYYLKKIRKQKGLSTTELAKHSGVGQRTIERIEGGLWANSSILTLCKLACALDVSVHDLFDCNCNAEN